jgi:hypothetical protein
MKNRTGRGSAAAMPASHAAADAAATDLVADGDGGETMPYEPRLKFTEAPARTTPRSRRNL